MIQILNIIAPLFLIIFLSALLQRIKNVGDNWSTVLNEFALKIGLPVLIFSALSKAPFSFFEQRHIILFNSLLILASFTLTFFLGKTLRFKDDMLRTLVICLMFSNIAYLGIPTLTQVFGLTILPTASLIVAIYLFWLFTVGVGFLDLTAKKKGFFKDIVINLFKNPLLIAVILGIAVASLNITLPNIMVSSMDMITASVTPTVLIVIGLFIGKSKVGKVSEWIPIFLFSIITLFVLPAGLYFGVKLLGFSPTQFSTSIIEAAMPLAITPFALADKYHLNKIFISRAIVLSTILSVASLPFWISIL